MKTTILLTVEHSKPLPDLTHVAAGRVWTLDGVTDVTAAIWPLMEIEADASVAKMDLSERGFQDGKEGFWSWLWRTQA